MDFDKYQMSKRDREVLRKCHMLLISNITLDADFFGELLIKDLLTENQMEELQNNYVYPTKKSKVAHLVTNIIPKKGPKAFDNFLEVLDDKHEAVANGLREVRGMVPHKTAGNKNNFEEVDASGDSEAKEEEKIDGIIMEDVINGKSSLTFQPIPERSYQASKAYPISGERHFLILNNDQFGEETNFSNREGSAYDNTNLTEIFKKLGFSCGNTKTNLTAEGIKSCLEEFCELYKKRQRNSDLLVIVLMSHGCKRAVYGIDGKRCTYEEIIKVFNSNGCKELEGKPKVFLIQACQTDHEDQKQEAMEGVAASDGHDTIDAKPDGQSEYGIELSDMYGFSSAVEGAASQHHKHKGSVFVRTFCLVMNYYGHKKDIVQIMNKVKYIMKNIDKESTGNLNEVQIYPQAASAFMNSLTKDVYFM